MAPDKTAILTHPTKGRIATRRKIGAVCETDLERVAVDMFKAAPDAKAVYFYTDIFNYEVINSAVTALKSAGYTNVKTLNSVSWLCTEALRTSGVVCKVGECVAVYFEHENWCFHDPYFYHVYQKTDDGYVIVDDGSWNDRITARCPNLNNVIIINNGLSVCDKTDLKDKFHHQKVHFIVQSDISFLKCIWDEFDGNVKEFLPVEFTLKVQFRYGNNVHTENFEYYQLPVNKTFELDIEDAQKLEISTAYNSWPFNTIDKLKWSPGKSRTLKIGIKVGSDFLPVVDVSVAREVEPEKSVVYSIDFCHDAKSQCFTGTLISANGANKTIHVREKVTDLFKILDAERGSAKLRGVFINYPNHKMFPLETHQAVINGLPSKSTKTCLGRTHSDLSIHLWHSGVKAEIGEHIVIMNVVTVDVRKNWTEIYTVVKTENGFKAVHRSTAGFLPEVFYEKTVVIVETKPERDHYLVQVWFGSKQIFHSATSTISNDALHDFACHYFNGGDFYGYMVEPYDGFGITFNHFDYMRNINRYFTCNDGVIKLVDTCLTDNQKYCTDECNHLDNTAFCVNVDYVGYTEKNCILKIKDVKHDFVHFKINVDEHLLPTVTYTQSDVPTLPVLNLPPKNANVAKPVSTKQVSGKESRTSDVSKVLLNKLLKDKIKELEKSVNVVQTDKGAQVVKTSVSDVSNVAEIASLSTTCVSETNPKKRNNSNVPLPTVVLTFTENNQVLIAAGSDYTGDIEIPSYFRLKYTNGTPEFLVGATAKATTKKSRKHLIFDVTGLLVANLKPDHEKNWTFDTSRADDGSLFVHLNAKDRTSPIVVFGHILRATLQHVNDHLSTKLERVGICLPSMDLISMEDLSKISSKLDVALELL